MTSRLVPDNSPRNVWLISEVYYPDEQGTAFYLTGLAEGLAKDFSVKVLCSNPTVTAWGTKVMPKEVRNGVYVERCMGTTFNKNVFVLRIINTITISLGIFVKALRLIRKEDVVIAVTSPPSLPFVTKLACYFRGAKCIMRIEDVYPETFVATGIIASDGQIHRFLGYLNKLLYRSIDRLVVLGRDMEELAKKKVGKSGNPVTIIHNWADTDIVSPQQKDGNPLLKELGIEGKFVVSCAGNMGRAQAIETMFEAAATLRTNDAIHFLFIGTGAKRNWMEREIVKRRLTNVTLVGQRPRADQINFLNACDISMISLLPGMTGAGVPSRMYNVMAAGKPIIAIAGKDSELSLVVREENIGWLVPSDNAERLVQTILDAQHDPERLKTMGYRAYTVAEEKYSRGKIIEAYADLVRGI